MQSRKFRHSRTRVADRETNERIDSESLNSEDMSAPTDARTDQLILFDVTRNGEIHYVNLNLWDERRERNHRSELRPGMDLYESDFRRRRTDDGRHEQKDDPYASSILLISIGRSSPTTKPVAVKYLKIWNSKFSGNANEDSKEFLYIESADIPVLDVL